MSFCKAMVPPLASLRSTANPPVNSANPETAAGPRIAALWPVVLVLAMVCAVLAVWIDRDRFMDREEAQHVQRALETHCAEVLMGKNGVDGVYTADPRKDPDAVKLDHLTYTDALVGDLAVMDATALSLCRDNAVVMRVFGLEEEGNVTRALQGEKIGTLVTAG